ncbi:TPA: hypothetical protein DCR49_00740 [Candidatus Delongbacteria bacterium]|nr:MAG: hypothetical protein A2Y39_02340 [Candidatus Delongbacteria bacterium GWF2_40_14]HAQ60525.1 hypothetical protein [Candidatus Delongbacteria bacterium]
MKKISIILVALLAHLMFADLINMNPDPNGEPWWAGGWKNPTADEQTQIDALPKLTLPDSYKNSKAKLAYALDNSVNQYFRPIFNQVGGSCAQASGIAYNMTYEMNFVRGTTANVTANQLPSHFTYNYLNDGSGANGSTYFQGWDIAKNCGVPDVATYGGYLWPTTNTTYQNLLWKDGFPVYQTGMNNRVSEVIQIPVGTPEGLATLKQYFNDHCDGSSAGGIVNFSAGVSYTFATSTLPAGTENAGQTVVLNWDPIVNHAMTFAGYNDSIRYDFNSDGRYTNDIDINGDSVVDMKDWEKGAVLMVNSWGTTWGTLGKAWAPYRTLALSLADGGINNNTVYTMKVKNSFVPQLKLKATVTYSDRKELKIYAGVSTDTTASVPQYTVSFPIFNYQGGTNIKMVGDTDSTIELGLDISSLLSYVDSAQRVKYFICVEQKDAGGAGTGRIVSMAVVDENAVTKTSSQSNVTIVTNSTTYMSVITGTSFNQPSITNSSLPDAQSGIPYSEQLSVSNGASPFVWDTLYDYTETANSNLFPTEAVNPLTTNSDDDGIARVDLDFDFPFYGKLYDHITVCTDGSILFGDEFVYVRNEGDIIATRAITVYSQDLQAYPVDGDGIFYYKNADHLTVRWKTSICGVQTANLEFAVKIYSNSNIEFFYGTGMTTGLVWSAGVSNGSSADCKISQYANTSNPSGLKTGFTTTDYPYGMELSSGGIFSGTLNGTDDTWNIKFRVTDSNNISDIKIIPFTLISAPGTPAITSFNATSSSATIVWDAVIGASSYRIYRSVQPYSGFAFLDTSSSTSYTDNNILSGNKYFYYITADNAK